MRLLLHPHRLNLRWRLAKNLWRRNFLPCLCWPSLSSLTCQNRAKRERATLRRRLRREAESRDGRNNLKTLQRKRMNCPSDDSQTLQSYERLDSHEPKLYSI